MELNILTIMLPDWLGHIYHWSENVFESCDCKKRKPYCGSGMAIAIFGTIFLYEDERAISLATMVGYSEELLIGAIIGTLAAKKVKMTAMPEMVSLFNGMGGACAALISIVEFNHLFMQVSVILRIMSQLLQAVQHLY